MNSTPMMKCGHVAQAVDSGGKPVCIICYPKQTSMEVDTEYKEPVGRKARCSYYGSRFKRNGFGANECKKCEEQDKNYCQCEVESSRNLAFFTSHPNKEYDEFYCGCQGWD